ncbi:MAG: ATP-grasp domain-containing protein [Paludibacteraceae bacterium]|nr:ATP-grasp domain-containing protein [Paludibacteraceae bacterium]
MRVLLGEISSYKAIVIARYIQQRYPNVELWAYDNKPLIQHLHSRYVNKCAYIPYTTLDDYIRRIATYIYENQIDVFIPVHSDFIGQILQHKHLFGCTLDYIGEYNDYVQLHEKNLLMQIANELQIDIPKTYPTIAEAQVPFVIKPTNLSSAKGVRYCHTIETKEQLKSISPSGLICQEYIQGQGCGYELYCRNGKIIAEYGHLRLAEWPTTGGSSVLRKGYIHPKMRDVAEKILAQVSWTGFIMFEFKLTDDGRLVMIEANPRIWGSINQALQNDCKLFTAILGAPTVSTSCEEKRTCLSPQVWLAMISYMCKGKWSSVKDYFKNLRITHSDVSVWEDISGVLSMIIRKLL